MSSPNYCSDRGLCPICTRARDLAAKELGNLWSEKPGDDKMLEKQPIEIPQRVETYIFTPEEREEIFVTKDSGQRQEFSTGMVRDTSVDKIRYDLVYMPMFKRWAELMTRGAKKYSAHNWKKAATQEELDRFKESAFRHFMTWFLGEDTSEDHAAAVFFNISGAEYVKGKGLE